MTVAAHIVGGLGDLHALTLEQRKALTDEEAAPYIYGTQWFCAGVATYVLFIWTLKFNMLFLYQRVVRGLWVEKFIKPVMLLLGATFIAIFLILFCACRPYNRMWVVYPDQGCKLNPGYRYRRDLRLTYTSHLQASVLPQYGTGSHHEHYYRYMYHGHPDSCCVATSDDIVETSRPSLPLQRRAFHHDCGDIACDHGSRSKF